MKQYLPSTIYKVFSSSSLHLPPPLKQQEESGLRHPAHSLMALETHRPIHMGILFLTNNGVSLCRLLSSLLLPLSLVMGTWLRINTWDMNSVCFTGTSRPVTQKYCHCGFSHRSCVSVLQQMKQDMSWYNYMIILPDSYWWFHRGKKCSWKTFFFEKSFQSLSSWQVLTQGDCSQASWLNAPELQLLLQSPTWWKSPHTINFADSNSEVRGVKEDSV